MSLIVGQRPAKMVENACFCLQADHGLQAFFNEFDKPFFLIVLSFSEAKMSISVSVSVKKPVIIKSYTGRTTSNALNC